VGNGGGDGTAINWPAGFSVNAGGPLIVVNWQRITVTVDIAAGAILGANDIKVTNAGAPQSNAVQFTVSNPLPTISLVTPGSGSIAAVTVNITIDGSGFINGVVVDGTTVTMTDFASAPIAVSSLTIVNSGQLTFTATLTGKATGVATISVTNVGRAAATAPFTVTL